MERYPGSTSEKLPATRAVARGGRKALCIGIDSYRTNALGGCVHDARNWAATLQSLGFETPQLLLEEAATGENILNAIEELIQSSSPGTSVVVQYSGHGTQLPSLTEVDGFDEALVPIDYYDGRYVIDDDLAAINNRTPEGVSVTYFMDCCHSGTITRLFVGGAPTQRDATVKSRFMPATAELIAAYRSDRKKTRQARATTPYTGRREVLFAACQSDESSYERGGQGDFTRAALAVLRRGIDGLTNANFIDRVRAQGVPQQHPQLWSDPQFYDQPLFGVRRAAPSKPPTSALNDALAELEATMAKLRTLTAQHGG